MIDIPSNKKSNSKSFPPNGDYSSLTNGCSHANETFLRSFRIQNTIQQRLQIKPIFSETWQTKLILQAMNMSFCSVKEIGDVFQKQRQQFEYQTMYTLKMKNLSHKSDR